MCIFHIYECIYIYICMYRLCTTTIAHVCIYRCTCITMLLVVLLIKLPIVRSLGRAKAKCYGWFTEGGWTRHLESEQGGWHEVHDILCVCNHKDRQAGWGDRHSAGHVWAYMAVPCFPIRWIISFVEGVFRMRSTTYVFEQSLLQWTHPNDENLYRS